MNIRFYILILTFIGFGCSDISKPVVKGMINSDNRIIQVVKSEVELRPTEGLIYRDDQPFTGRVVSTFANDIIQESIEYVSGRKYGHHKKWFANGELAFDARWQNGLLDGISTSWWSNGNKRSETNQVLGKLHGVQLQWYPSGNIFKQRNMNMGVEEGLQRSWRENGKVYNNYEAKNGRIFGLKRASLCFQLDNEEIQISK